MLLRLAGMGLRGLGKGVTNPGAVGKIVRGVGTTAAELGVLSGLTAAGGTAIDLGLNDGIYNRQQELLNKGPKNDGSYQLNLGDRIKSGISGAFGGETFSPEDMKGALGDRNFRTINDPKNAAIKADLVRAGVDLSRAGRGTENIDSLSAEFSGKIAKGKRKDAFNEKVELADLLDQRRRSSPEYIRERAIADEARDFRRQSSIDSRNDALLGRQQSLDLGMAQLNASSANANREFDYLDKKLDYDAVIKKDARRAKILAALGGLGMMFAA